MFAHLFQALGKTYELIQQPLALLGNFNCIPALALSFPQVCHEFQGSHQIGRTDEQHPFLIGIGPKFAVFLDGYKIGRFDRNKHHDKVQGSGQFFIFLATQLVYVGFHGLNVLTQSLLLFFAGFGSHIPVVCREGDL